MNSVEPKRVLVIIPAYNEEDNIEWVVNELQEVCPDYDYLVVNDGSKDRTAEICKDKGFNMISMPVNLGLTNAVIAGMRYALLKGYDAAIQYDGDGQHRPECISLLEECLNRGADVAIGSRFVQEKKPVSARMIGSRLISNAIRIRTGKKINDPTSGMRMYGKRVLQEYISDINYGPEPDTISYLISKGMTVEEVQVQMRERIAGTSYLNVFKSMGYMANMLTSILIIQGMRRREA